ncbi:replication protein A 70 kDa DNA-binding subunit D [Tanacetum coccineum]
MKMTISQKGPSKDLLNRYEVVNDQDEEEIDEEDDETGEQDDKIDEEAEDGKDDSDDELWSPKTIRTTAKNLIRRGEGPGQGEQGAGQERKDRMSKSSRYFQMIVQDEKGFKIHMIIDNFQLKAINKVFKRGMVVVISDFNVVPNDHNLKFTNHPFKIKFNPDTKAHIIGGVIGWENEMTGVEASNGKIVKTLGITLKDSTGIVDYLVTSYLANKLLNYIITHEVKEMFYVKLQYAKVHYDGEGYFTWLFIIINANHDSSNKYDVNVVNDEAYADEE